MDNLKSIWNQLNYDSNNFELNNKGGKDSIFEKLKHEQKLRTKFLPFLIMLIIVFTFVFGYIVYKDASGLSTSKLIGITLMTLGSISIAFFSQVIKMPLNQYENDKSSIDFLKQVKDKLNQSKMMLVVGLILQISFLTSGLYLIIFYNANDANLGHLYSFLGTMMGLGGLAVGGSIASFNIHYKPTLKMIDSFLNEN